MSGDAYERAFRGQPGLPPRDIIALSPWAIPRLAAAPPSPVAALDPGVLHVLVVDEIQMNRDIAASFLHAAGHRVTCVEGGVEAISAFKSTKFSVLLMDVRMPQMDGLETTRRIRAIEGARAHERDRFGTYASNSRRSSAPGGARARVPIVALTARAYAEQVAECREAGMDGHVSKPFTPHTLLATILRAVTSGPTLGESQTPDSGPVPAHIEPTPAIGSRKVILDQAAFERTAVFLPPETINLYVQGIGERATSLLQALRGTATPAHGGDELAEAAHTIAGCAGLLGFERLSYLGCRFERAITCEAPDTVALAYSLCAALEDTLTVIRNRPSPAAEA
jgi:CheY-like chemotaxis protein/HPt (histidine-containing phosphotransfer) domain-containing protein